MYTHPAKPEDGYNIISNRMLQKYLFWELTSPCVAVYYYYWGMNVFMMHANTRDVSGNYYSIMLHFNVNLVY